MDSHPEFQLDMQPADMVRSRDALRRFDAFMLRLPPYAR
jgi:hypothetical protein